MEKRISLITNERGHCSNLLNRPCTIVMLSSRYIINTITLKKAIIGLNPNKIYILHTNIKMSDIHKD